MVLRTDTPKIPERRIICPGAQPQSQVLGDPYFPTTLDPLSVLYNTLYRIQNW
jgi:hypothetical protein